MLRRLLPQIGSWSFIIGVIISLVAGLWNQSTSVTSVIIILGVVVGFLNIRGKEAMTFLLASVSLVLMSAVGSGAFIGIPVLGKYLEHMLNNLILFTMPAAMIVALRVIVTLAYKK